MTTFKTFKKRYEFLGAGFNPLATHDSAIKTNFNRGGLFFFYLRQKSYNFTTAFS